jgi:hypothetical protein
VIARVSAAGLLLLLAAARPANASAEDCESAHLDAQELRSETKLLSARDALIQCAAKSCPGLIQEDCAQWLVEVQKNIPTIVPAARTSTGRDLSEVRVRLGDRVLTERLDGKPIEVDPGSYTLTFETRAAEPLSVDFVAQAGVKNRVVEAEFPADAAPAAESGSLPLPFWILAGVGTAALVSFGVFALLGQNDYSELQADCAPRCDPGESDAVRTKFLIADVSLGVAAAAYAGAAYFYFAAPRRAEPVEAPQARRPATRVGLAPLPGGGVATLQARF